MSLEMQIPKLLWLRRPLPGSRARAAAEFGLPAGRPVGTSAIDAHAGGIGAIGARLDGDASGAEAFRRRIALVGGTSSCPTAVSPEPRFVPGAWGPDMSAMVPGLWLNEGGQSATGALIDHLDHVITTHAAYPACVEDARAAGRSVYEALDLGVSALSRGLPHPVALTAGPHVMPDVHGNRSPRADATLRGNVSGLSLSATADLAKRMRVAEVP